MEEERSKVLGRGDLSKGREKSGKRELGHVRGWNLYNELADSKCVNGSGCYLIAFLIHIQTISPMININTRGLYLTIYYSFQDNCKTLFKHVAISSWLV